MKRFLTVLTLVVLLPSASDSVASPSKSLDIILVRIAGSDDFDNSWLIQVADVDGAVRGMGGIGIFDGSDVSVVIDSGKVDPDSGDVGLLGFVDASNGVIPIGANVLVSASPTGNSTIAFVWFTEGISDAGGPMKIRHGLSFTGTGSVRIIAP